MSEYEGLGKTLGRTASAVYAIRNILLVVLSLGSVDEVDKFLKMKGYSTGTREGFKELWRRVKLTDYKSEASLNKETKTLSVPLHQGMGLDKALESLDQYVSGLTERISETIILAVAEQNLKYKAEKEAEIAELKAKMISLQTVVDVAKQNNLTASIKRALMGE